MRSKAEKRMGNKMLIIQLSSEDAESVMHNDKHGNAQTIVDMGGSYRFDVVAEISEEDVWGYAERD